jgi:ABC-type Mn/Zn transport systems, ATPase component
MKIPPHALDVHHLTVQYGGKLALWDVNLNLPTGSLTAIIGPNGAGKSTLIKALLQLIAKTSGSVHFFGQDLHQVQKQIAYMPQREAVDWSFPITVRDLVTQGCLGRLGWFQKIPSHESSLIQEALTLLDLEKVHNQLIGDLSGGQQKKAFLARALVQRANIYLLDEPLAALDHASSALVIQHLKTLRDQGKTILVVHHDLSEIHEVFDHVLLLNIRKVAFGKTEDVFTPHFIRETYGQNFELLQEAILLSQAKQKGLK